MQLNDASAVTRNAPLGACHPPISSACDLPHLLPASGRGEEEDVTNSYLLSDCWRDVSISTVV